ncbi:hypothetical protein [Salisediminibacterium beveridgei]|uniref:Uncharacterized protein n=1 Tax=Salisediminibacterium beveridgei TaxID=632773 RepID=A0A1D7R007_9BACI|nr:hypothetical protein [Salisediminibacterium beveridgei]AOM84597.1 hypothetical protein BBEV_3282 [Salisediminibacterium beveridgei]
MLTDLLSFLFVLMIFWLILFSLLRAVSFVTKRAWKKDLLLGFFQAVLLTAFWYILV